MNNLFAFAWPFLLIWYFLPFMSIGGAAGVHNQVDPVHVIIRKYDTEIVLVSPVRAIRKEYRDVEVLSEEGFDQISYTVFGYDNFTRIKSLVLTIKDSEEKIIKRVKKKDFIDQAAVGNSTIYSDSRVLYYHINEIKPPYSFTVEAEVEINQLMAIPTWRPINGENVNLKSGSLSIKCFKDMDIQYRSNLIGDPSVNSIQDQKHYKWSLRNVASVQNLSVYDSELTSVLPEVRWVPLHFEFGGIKGGFATWQDFGSWLYALSEDTRSLPAAAKEELHEFISQDMTQSEKIKAVYGYLQERVRYVSVQLGIGGWKPYSATSVHENQYGDCKALSNYTQALLSEIGITSYYTVIFSGRYDNDYVKKDFPSNSFNHVVLLVPVENDTILLECTSQSSPCGFKGSGTDNRFALAVGKNKSRLFRTDQFDAIENVQVDSVFISIDQGGKMKLQSHTELYGSKAEIFTLIKWPETEQRKWISDHVVFAQFNIDSHSLEVEEIGDWDYKVILTTALISKNFSTISGRRIFFTPAVYHEFGEIGLPDSVQFSFNLSNSYQFNTYVEFDLPENYTIESTLEDREIVRKFGRYKITFNYIEETNKLGVFRHFEINKGVYPRDLYKEYKLFRKEIWSIEQDEIVLVR